jgi:diguanylate cyclase (GGDEF)-like protein
MNNVKRKIGILLTLLIIFLNTGIFADSNELSQKRVLLINSYNPSFSTFYQQIDGIDSILKSKGILLDVEFMDSKRLFTDENMSNFYESLKYKLESLPAYDTIIVSDDNSLDFVMAHNDDLFKNIPIVFMGINNIEKALAVSEKSHITGVVEAISLKETIDLACHMNPQADRVLAIVDGTTSGRGDYEVYLKIEENYQDMTFESIDLSEMTFEAYKNRLSQVSDKDVLILLSAFSDKNGQRVEFNEIVETLNTYANVPVYHPYLHGIGEGLLGGKVISHKEQGKVAAGMVLQILNGTSPDVIHPIMNSPNVYTFDYNVMEAYGFKVDDVPKNSVLINYTQPLWLKYLVYIIMAVGIIGIQIILIIYLMITIRKKKLSERRLLENKKDLVIANDELSATYEELYDSYEEVEFQNEQIQKLINIDDLTGLDNRYAISNRIDQLIKYCDASEKIAIMFLDVDNFKGINDMFGHDVGDEVIKITGERLKSLLSEDIFIGRFGGDEFLIVYKDYRDDRELEKLINKVREAFLSQILINERKFYLTVSIGIVEYPKHGKSQKELIKRADISLYKAKFSGKDNYVFYNEGFNDGLEYSLKIQHLIKEAYMDNCFSLNYQPIIDVKTEQLMGFEALIRWYNEELGQVSPHELITNAEEMGLIVDIGHWVMKEAFAFTAQCNKDREESLYVSINVSALQLKYHGFVEDVTCLLNETGLLPSLIILETTETAFIDCMDVAAETLVRLKELGVGLALDDFGTGYSSLNYLKNLPVNILKIDRTFVKNMGDDSFDQLLIEVIVQLAKSKDLKVIAEGVEEESQLKILSALGCHYIQGYYYSKPLKLADALNFAGK